MISYFIEWFKNHKDPVWQATRLNERRVKRAQRGRTNIETWKQWEHRGWGDSIGIERSENGKWSGSGHLFSFPEVGDELLFKTRGGYQGKAVFLTIEPCRDPNDMLFFDLSEPIFIKEAELLEKQKVLG